MSRKNAGGLKDRGRKETQRLEPGTKGGADSSEDVAGWCWLRTISGQRRSGARGTARPGAMGIRDAWGASNGPGPTSERTRRWSSGKGSTVASGVDARPLRSNGEGHRAGGARVKPNAGGQASGVFMSGSPGSCSSCSRNRSNASRCTGSNCPKPCMKTEAARIASGSSLHHFTRPRFS